MKRKNMSPRLESDTLEERKAQILKAALTCFARKGYHQTTMDDIVEETDLSKGGIYWHFGSKQELFLAVLESVISDTKPILWQDVGSQADARARLRSTLDMFTTLVTRKEFQELMPLLIDVWGQNKLDPKVNQTVKRAYKGFRRPLVQLIEQGIINGEFKRVDAAALAGILFALYDGLMVQWMIDETAVDWDAVNETLMNTLVAGLLTNAL